MPRTYIIDAPLDVDQVSALDLREEIEGAQSEEVNWEAFRLVQIGEDGNRTPVTGTMLWFPESGRAGIEWGSCADWTDADSPEQALERWANNEMIN